MPGPHVAVALRLDEPHPALHGGERLQLQLNVENLLDEDYYPYAHNNNNITPGSPRAVRAGVIARF